jgi:hypothetical protein
MCFLTYRDDKAFGEPSRGYIFDLICSTYFRRIWTIPELALAQCATVICGNVSLPWLNFVSGVWAFIQQKDKSGTRTADTFHSSLMPWYMRCQCIALWESPVGHKKSKTELAREILMVASTQEATDARDRVFTLHPLFCKVGIPLPAPDYRLSLERVYTEATRAIISSTGSLTVLNKVTRVGNSIFPSWVPDLRASETALSFTLNWNASRDSRLSKRPVSLSVAALPIDGRSIDSIRHVGAKIGHRSDRDGTSDPVVQLKLLFEPLRDCFSLVKSANQQNKPYAGRGQSLEEAFFHALTPMHPSESAALGIGRENFDAFMHALVDMKALAMAICETIPPVPGAQDAVIKREVSCAEVIAHVLLNYLDSEGTGRLALRLFVM